MTAVKATEARLRIRIFGEAGMGAAALPPFRDASVLEGRTVRPDGTVTPFKGVRDLVQSTLRFGRWDESSVAMVPPGRDRLDCRAVKRHLKPAAGHSAAMATPSPSIFFHAPLDMT